MGDHRCSIQIKMKFHGVEKECDMHINWYPLDGGIDSRVVDFIEDVIREGMNKYENEKIAYELERKKTETEKFERSEYERLKRKYDRND